MLKIKLLARGKALTPYIAACSTNGKVQMAFREQIGIPTGACVKAAVRQGMTQKEIRDAVRKCAVPKRTELRGPFKHGSQVSLN